MVRWPDLHGCYGREVMEIDGNEHRNDGMSCRKSELINIERRVAAFSMVI